MKIIPSVIVSILLLILSSCHPKLSSTGQKLVKDEHNSQNALDWEGHYVGSQSCSICLMDLITFDIKYDNTITKHQAHYDSDSISSIKGVFSWDDEGSHILVKYSDNTNEKLQIGKNHLTVIRDDRPNAKFTRMYKSSHNLQENYWKLVWAFDTDIKPEMITNREPHIIFKTGNNIICQGHDGCQNFKFGYQIDELNRLSIKTTNYEACTPSDIATLMRKAMHDVFYFRIDGDNMYWMNKANKVIAKFEVVFLR